MKTIHINLYATLRKYHPQGEGSQPFSLELEDPEDIQSLLHRLQIPEDESKQVFVNNRRQENNYQLKEGDRVAIFPPIAGG